ncbi:MAG: gliding motility-associated C-terminal domain-containing protein [Cyclobacteriaceae bacterium]|nr:gliding motility-associated C-terminal domain-containing protein [Cyclobacteriaceae bacterium]
MWRLFIVCGLLLSAIDGSAQITSTFNANAQGWTAPDANPAITYSAAGGNPGGYVAGNPFVIVLGATTLYVPFYFVAPATYLGNRSTYYNGTLRYDVQQSTTGAPNSYAEVIIANSLGVTLYYFPPISNQPPAAPSWATYSVVLNNTLGYWKTTNSSTGGAATEAQIQNILLDLASLQIRGLYRDANTNNRLDNVTFYPPIVITTQPTSVSVCDGISTTFTTAAIGNAAITYQWQRETTPGIWTNVTNTGGYSGATTASLGINTTGNFGGGNYRCVVSGTAVVDVITNTATLTITALPAAPGTTGAARCGAGTVTLTATGAAAGQYRWYTVATGGTAIAGQTNATYATPALAATTIYYVAINNGTCEGNRTAVTATINTIPGAPGTTGASACGTSSVTLTATGAAAGQYRWYTVATGGTAIAGQTNATYATPVLAATTIYYVAINNGTCEGNRTAVTATINTIPGAPGTTGASACGTSSVTLTATGAAAGQYRWYTVATGGTAIAGQTNATYATPALAATTIYYVAINNGTCEGNRTAVTATINTIPGAPGTTGAESCTPASLVLTATGGTAGQYRWYTVATGGTPIAGETNATYTTPVLTVTTSYYVAITTGICESTRTQVLASIAPPVCTNEPPAINVTAQVIQIGGTITIDLTQLISDPDNNLDLSTLSIVTMPQHAASAFIDGSFNLIINYSGVPYTGKDSVAIRVCDTFTCTTQQIQIDVVGEIKIYNALSPGNDGRNDFFKIEHIAALSTTRENEVFIYNRWGDIVWEGTNYDNDRVVFTGKSKHNTDLPTGTYFYRIQFESGRKPESGYLELKR